MSDKICRQAKITYYFTLFILCIVDNQFTTHSQQNAQYSSLDIYIIISC
jgi:hypothetical protein